MNQWRDPRQNEIIILPVEEWHYPGYEERGGPFRNTIPRKPDVDALLSGEGVRLPEFAEAGDPTPGDKRFGFR